MADLAAHALDQRRHVVAAIGKRLAESLAERGRERIDLADGRRPARRNLGVVHTRIEPRAAGPDAPTLRRLCADSRDGRCENRAVDAPTPESYWVVAGGLLAGKYPLHVDARGARSRLSDLLAEGVTLFVDLTEELELEPYVHALDGAARHVRMPVRDMDVPSVDQMRRTLDLIDRELARGGIAYVHCWGGAGRTGTVVGCWLVRHGLDSETALRRIAELRADAPALWLDSPQTAAQRAMVRAWAE
jgi:protein-tyrosine phosphatase